MGTLPAALARAHSWARSQPWLGRFTLMNRLLLAMAFLPTGLVKATGQRFTLLPVENPVGFFFEAMYQTGPYWYFIGFSQVAAAILLVVPATATLGALLSLPISLSIFLVTWGIGFGNTVYIAAGMLLSVTYLLCWDADRIWSAGALVLGSRRGPHLLAGANRLETTGWVIGGAVGIGFFLVTRSFLPNAWTNELFFVGLGAIAMVLIGWVYGLLRARSSSP